MALSSPTPDRALLEELESSLLRVRRRLTDLCLGGQAWALFSERFGGAGSDPEAFASRLSALLAEMAAGGGLPERFGFRPAADLQGARAVYVPAGAGREEAILLNTDALLALPEAERAGELDRLLLEEIGHGFDRRLNGDLDSVGDEGEAFALRLLGITPDAAAAARIAAEDDSALLWIDGAPVRVEQAAPVLADTALAVATVEDAGTPAGAVGTLVSSLVGGISDADANALRGLAIVGANQTNGTWWFTINGGSSWSQLGAVSSSSALLLAADTLTRLWFAPKANWNGSVADGLTVRGWDRTTGSNGARRNLNNSYYVYDTFSPLVYTNNSSDPAETAAQRSWAGGWSRSTSTFIRLDTSGLVVRGLGSGTENVSRSVDLSGATAATLSFQWRTTSAETDDVFLAQSRSSATDSWTTLGTFTTISNGVWRSASVNIAGDDLTNTAQIRFITLDGGDFAGLGDRFSLDNVKVRWNGDISVSSASDSVAVNVAAVNDPPQLSGTIPDQAASQDSAFSYTFPTAVFSDADGTPLTYSASLTGGGALPSWLRFNATTRTFSGTPANADVGSLNVRVTASDGLASVSTTFRIVVADRNDGPIVATPIPDQITDEDSPFSFVVPAGTFADIDPGTVLTYSARLSSGAPLPSWLSFTAATRTFSGTPLNGDVGNLSVRVTASDGQASVSDDFSLTVRNVNDPPVVAQPIPAQRALEGQAFIFAVPVGTFTDEDAGTDLSLSARQANGAALPAWLRFEPAIDTFIGFPDDAEVGDWLIRVTASDGLATVSTDFRLTVENVNDFPIVAEPLPAQSGQEFIQFNFTVPEGNFVDPDAGTVLRYSASLADGSSLPSWLSFDAGQRRLSGVPGGRDAGDYEIRITATDPAGASASSTFLLQIEQSPAGRSVEAVGNTELLAFPNGSFAAKPTESNSAPELIRYEGSPFLQEILGPSWDLLGAESVVGQNRIAWRDRVTGLLERWDADADWNWSGRVSDINPDDVEGWQLEQDFGQDFNGDQIVGAPLTPVDSQGIVSLLQGRNRFWIRQDGKVKPLKLRGAQAQVDPQGRQNPIAAETINGLNRVLMFDRSTGLINIWTADADWDGTSEGTPLAPSTPSGWGWETRFDVDIDLDGVIGTPFEVIENRGAFRLLNRSGSLSVQDGELVIPVMRAGTPVQLSGPFPETPLAAEEFGGINQLLVKDRGNGQLRFWRMDDSWNWVATLSSVDPLSGNGQKLEARFGADVNGDGLVRRLRQSTGSAPQLNGNALDEYLLPSGGAAVTTVRSGGGQDVIAIGENGLNRFASRGDSDLLVVTDFDPRNDRLVVIGGRSYLAAPLTLASVSGAGLWEDRDRNGLLSAGDELLAHLQGVDSAGFSPTSNLMAY